MFTSIKKIKRNRGMTYIELIVVLSIFAIMTSVVLFNYGAFQAKVDIKNLGSDVALRILEAQRTAISGIMPPAAKQSLMVSASTWRPSYGVYFSTVTNSNVDNKSFIYFADLDYSSPALNGIFDGTACTGECMDKTTISKGSYVSHLDVCYQGNPTPNPCTLVPLNDLTITFQRPNSGAILKSSGLFGATVSYVQITISAPGATSNAFIKVYPSGRIQVN